MRRWQMVDSGSRHTGWRANEIYCRTSRCCEPPPCGRRLQPQPPFHHRFAATRRFRGGRRASAFCRVFMIAAALYPRTNSGTPSRQTFRLVSGHTTGQTRFAGDGKARASLGCAGCRSSIADHATPDGARMKSTAEPVAAANRRHAGSSTNRSHHLTTALQPAAGPTAVAELRRSAAYL